MKDIIVDNTIADGWCLRESDWYYVFYKENGQKITYGIKGQVKQSATVDTGCYASKTEHTTSVVRRDSFCRLLYFYMQALSVCVFTKVDRALRPYFYPSSSQIPVPR